MTGLDPPRNVRGGSGPSTDDLKRRLEAASRDMLCDVCEEPGTPERPLRVAGHRLLSGARGSRHERIYMHPDCEGGRR